MNNGKERASQRGCYICGGKPGPNVSSVYFNDALLPHRSLQTEAVLANRNRARSTRLQAYTCWSADDVKVFGGISLRKGLSRRSLKVNELITHKHTISKKLTRNKA